jgi:hypothetical protein
MGWLLPLRRLSLSGQYHTRLPVIILALSNEDISTHIQGTPQNAGARQAASFA